jgi:O-antigen ligase
MQPPLLIGGMALILGVALLSVFAGCVAERGERGRPTYRSLAKDPILWLGATFLLFLAVQWWNTGRHLEFDSVASRWGYTPPPHPGWPSSITRREAFEMICWFLPALGVALAVRSPWVTRRHVWGLYYVLSANAAVLSAFGIYRFLIGSKTIWGVEIGDKFFATFGYINHGSAFFVLASALTVGLLMRECFAQDRRARAWVIAALLVAAVLNMVGVHLSFCRAGMAFAWSFVLIAGIYGIRRSRRDLTPARQAYLAIGVVAIALIAFLAIAHLAHREVLRELEQRIGQSEFTWAQYFFGGRERSFPAAWAIWKDNPWFGVGGWGFSHFLACYIPQSLWTWAAEPGWANVHNDPLQFLAEFGVVGAGLLALSVVLLIASIVQSGVWRRSIGVMVLLGCTMVWLHSLIDLPFRCPAILYTWSLLLAVLPKVTGDRRQETGSGEGNVERRTLNEGRRHSVQNHGKRQQHAEREWKSLGFLLRLPPTPAMIMQRQHSVSAA